MKLVTNLRIVSLSDKGFPATRERPVVGDVYLTPSRTELEMYDQWIWTGCTNEWQKVGSIPSLDEEKSMRQRRVENVKSYFKKKREQYVNTMVERLADELNAIGTAFEDLKDEQD